MVVKVYISGISGNKEVKKRQQRVLMILDSKNIKYDVIDITEPGREADKDFMQNNAKSNGGTVSDPNPRSPLPPQIFNDDEYCGDYDQFDLANEVDTLEQYLKVEVPEDATKLESVVKENAVNGDVTSGVVLKEGSQEKELSKSKEGSPASDNAKEKSPAPDESVSKEPTPDRQKSVERQATSTATTEKELSPGSEEFKKSSKEASPEAESSKKSSKEASPELEAAKKSSKEASPEIEVPKKSSKEASPEKDELVNENGLVSSREQSVEKEKGEEEIKTEKDNPSESLIQSEQAAANE